LGVSPSDPLTYGAVVFSFALVALLASWLPARRAARIHPVEALRGE
jgi:ABC-type lipoprotein release transport system permease subunit